MSELRQDPVTGRWVIIATERGQRGTDFHFEPVHSAPDPACPFCEGHEHMTERELLAVRPPGSAADAPGWSVRVVPNQFPVVQADAADPAGGGVNPSVDGVLIRMPGAGAHEVIIESPRHEATLATLTDAAVEEVLWVARERVRDLTRDRRVRSVIVFKNHGGAAGASLAHSHSQIVALPIVPRELRDEVDGAAAYHQRHGRCVFCDLLRQELAGGRRVIAETAGVVAIAPYAARFPFETWLVPVRHQSSFEDAPRLEIASLAPVLGDILRRMNSVFRDPPYNLLIHTAPAGEAVADSYHWHVEVIPRLTRVSGFEWGSGIFMNPTAPEDAAQQLRDATRAGG